MEELKIEVYPHSRFEEVCNNDGYNDGNVEKIEDWAFIDIIGTKECLKYYLDEEDTVHWFKENHPNVLNLEFDDISGDELEYKGHIFKGLSKEQAQNAVDFIERNKDKNFRICCRAGMSRSRAFAEYVCRLGAHQYPERNEYTTMLNYGVLKKLLDVKKEKQ